MPPSAASEKNPGGLNRRLGWALLTLGFAWAIWLDPWSLSRLDPSALPGSAAMASRHAQAVLLGMGFLQLLMAGVLRAGGFSPAVRAAASGATGTGAFLYALGYVLLVTLPGAAPLIPLGALLNFGGLALLAGRARGEGGPPGLRWLLGAMAFGMLLDAAMGLFTLEPARFRPAYLGPDDGVRLRMLRLARAAAIALPLLALLFEGLPAARGVREAALRRWGGLALRAGAVGMPLVLSAAAFLHLSLKYLLPLPADAVFAGTAAGAWLARGRASRLEAGGWLLIALSMAAGLLMGGYAFDGPLPAPEGLGGYNDYPRRLSRLAHAYAIVLGLLALFAGRAGEPGGRAGRLLAVGIGATLLGVLARAALPLPAPLLAVGPALVTAALLLLPRGGEGGVGESGERRG